MGYYASGEGKAKLKQNVNIENLVADIERIYGEGSIELEIQNDTIIIFSDDNSHWHEEYTEQFLDVLSPYVESGCFNYLGEDGDIWRYRFISENGYWLEEKPQIVYGLNDFSDEILIQELENCGYQCTVNNKNMEIDDIER